MRNIQEQCSELQQQGADPQRLAHAYTQAASKLREDCEQAASKLHEQYKARFAGYRRLCTRETPPRESLGAGSWESAPRGGARAEQLRFIFFMSNRG